MDGEELPTIDDMDCSASCIPTPIDNEAPTATPTTPAMPKKLTTREKYSDEYSPTNPGIRIVKRKPQSTINASSTPKRIGSQKDGKSIPIKSILRKPAFKRTKSDKCIIFADTVNLPLVQIKEIEKIGMGRRCFRPVSPPLIGRLQGCKPLREYPLEPVREDHMPRGNGRQSPEYVPRPPSKSPFLHDPRSLPFPPQAHQELQQYRLEQQFHQNTAADTGYEQSTVKPAIQQVFETSEPINTNQYTATMLEPKSSPESMTSGDELPAELKELLNKLKTNGIVPASDEESQKSTNPFTVAKELAEKIMEKEKPTELVICDDSIPMNDYVATFAAPQPVSHQNRQHLESWTRPGMPRGVRNGPHRGGYRNHNMSQNNHYNQVRDFRVKNTGGYGNGTGGGRQGPNVPNVHCANKWRRNQQKFNNGVVNNQHKYYQ